MTKRTREGKKFIRSGVSLERHIRKRLLGSQRPYIKAAGDDFVKLPPLMVPRGHLFHKLCYYERLRDFRVIFGRGMLLIISYIFERLHLTSYLVTFEKTIMAQNSPGFGKLVKEGYQIVLIFVVNH